MASRSVIGTSGDLRRLAAQLAPNAYVTDGRRLFRCLRSVGEAMVLLEDCMTMELVHCTLGELHEAGVRLVRPGSDSRGESNPELVSSLL